MIICHLKLLKFVSLVVRCEMHFCCKDGFINLILRLYHIYIIFKVRKWRVVVACSQERFFHLLATIIYLFNSIYISILSFAFNVQFNLAKNATQQYYLQVIQEPFKSSIFFKETS